MAKYDLGNVTGPQGLPGEKGEPGEPGRAATISVGEVKTGAPGSAASVENIGTEQDAVLNFILPCGESGDSGGLGLMAFEVDQNGCLIVKTADNATPPPLSIRDGCLILEL